MGIRGFYTVLLFFCTLIISTGIQPGHPEANDARSLKDGGFTEAESGNTTSRGLVGVWDLARIDNRPATDVFTTEFKTDGTYSVITVHCRKERGVWSATRETITATVTHSPNCERNVGRRYTDRFSLYGNILIVYVFDKKNREHAYKFRKRTVLLST